MTVLDSLLDQFLVKPGKKLKLSDHDPGWQGDAKQPKSERKAFAEETLGADIATLSDAQDLLYASDTWSLLVVFQALDAAGKDGTIKHVMSGVNPQGVQVTSFKAPSAEELDHDYLWRCHKALPERGRIGIFNRSYYEEVLVVRVHPELIGRQRIPGAVAGPKLWQQRYGEIRDFERYLSNNGTAVVKFFLNVSREEQRQRFLERIREPEKNWKFSLGDIEERKCWDDYQQAYQECLEATSTEQAPWYVVPADHKWVTRAVVSRILVNTIQSMKLKYPEVGESQRAAIAEAGRALEAEAPAKK